MYTPEDAELGITTPTNKLFRMASNGIVPPDPNHPNSLRTIRATWAGQTREKSEKSNEKYKEKFDLRRNGNRLIVFCLGGITYSEIRSVYEVTKEAQREIFIGLNYTYIGSTFVYNPVQFVDILSELHNHDVVAITSPTQVSALPSPEIHIEKEVISEKKKTGIFSKRK